MATDYSIAVNAKKDNETREIRTEVQKVKTPKSKRLTVFVQRTEMCAARLSYYSYFTECQNVKKNLSKERQRGEKKREIKTQK
jgi:hypothetical protein